MIDMISSISVDIAIKQASQDLIEDKSTLL